MERTSRAKEGTLMKYFSGQAYKHQKEENGTLGHVPPEKSTPDSLYFPDVSSLMSRNIAASKETPDAASTPLRIYNVFQKCQRKVLTIVFIICFRKNVI
ncbi:hypothetical protein AVEN_156839-1 [Araneus ventricosus]|uniref:Uncharacterized protein n=1 Tax=Araneus ventricosus TaxID=182803 RepID=A0A4Y2TVZ2_ARAVE|nr:hypothetical protein AVEN_156839-1 [Araneus ventricosus]